MAVSNARVAADLANHRDHRQPWSLDQTCPACATFGMLSLTYTEQQHYRGPDGMLDVSVMGGLPDPHHIVTCRHCHFQWEMEVPGAGVAR